jgi:hypothetical protein
MSKRLDDDEARIVMIKAGVEPLVTYPGNVKRWKSKCVKCGAIIYPMRSNIQKGQGACKPCGTAKAHSKTRLKETSARREIIRIGNFTPFEHAPFLGVDVPWEGICNFCGKRSKPTLTNVRKTKSGCASCGNRKRAERERLQLAPKAYRIMILNWAKPLVPFPGVAREWKSMCLRCKRLINPKLHNIKNGQGACQYCDGARLSKDESDRILYLSGFEALEETSNANKKILARCVRCKIEYGVRVSSLRQGIGCRSCMKTGFDPRKSAILYLVGSEARKVVKVGITNVVTKRMRQHMLQGLELIHEIELSGQMALTIEAEVIRWWREELNQPPSGAADEFPYGGHTETVSWSAVAPDETWNYVLKMASSFEC